MTDFRKLRVWRASSDLVVVCYQATEGFPRSEEFGLKSQVRRSAVSIPSNIAEGSGRHSDRDFARFLRIAAGSASELECHVVIAGRLGFMTRDGATQIEEDIVDVRKMLSGLIRSISDSR